MDPDAVWMRMLDALETGDFDEAQIAGCELLTWINRGGFPPAVVPDRQLPRAWVLEVVRTACLATWKRLDVADE